MEQRIGDFIDHARFATHRLHLRTREILSQTHNYFFHPMSPLPTSPPAPPPTPTMNDPEAVERAISSASWAENRIAIVNRDSDTISVFEDPKAEKVNPEEIPLSVRGVPVIPHLLPHTRPRKTHPQLPASEANRDGFSSAQLKKLHEIFLGLQSVEFFFDRIVILRVTKEYYASCLESAGGDRVFSGYGCVMWLLAIAGPPTVYLPPAPEAEKDDVVQPGCGVYNSRGEYSTLGVFLVQGQQYPNSAIDIEYFTVSAHSYLKKVAIDLGMNWASLLVVPFCVYMGYVEAITQAVDISLCRQYAIARMCIALFDWILVKGGLESKVLPSQETH